jgi:hypothetical protein
VSSLEGELRARLTARTRARDAAHARSEQLGNLRLLLAGGALILILLPLFTKEGSPWLGLIPVAAAFLVLGKLQDRAFEKERRSAGAARFHREALDRIEEKWRELPDHGQDLADDLPPAHYAGDLDLFGKASLYQLVSRALTQQGRRTLASWLKEPASIAQARERQAAVRELAEKLDFSESLYDAAAGGEVGPIDDRKLVAWAEADAPLPVPGLMRALGIVLPIVLLATLIVFMAGGPRAPLIVAVLVQVIAVYATRNVTEPRASVLSGPERALRRYASLIAAIESAKLESELLVRSQGSLQGASQRIRALTRLVDLLDARLNMFFALSIGPALMWDLNLTLRAERWRKEVGPSLKGWFAAIGELEAIVSLAALARERPDYAYPVFVERERDGGGGAHPDKKDCAFEAVGLQHPLIDRNRVVPNDLTLGGAGSVLMLSGSNMSGKSTLLRSVGINQVLARAGGPVAALSMSISDLVLATSVRVVDSLAHGTSHFYAELARLKHVVDLAQSSPQPVLYLLDEMLHGTNSRERFIGAVSVIRWLAKAGSMGIVTTHDLMLAKVADELPPGRVTNRHFSDEVEDGKMRFDYRLREGPVASTNALRLMRAVGIDVDYEM